MRGLSIVFMVEIHSLIHFRPVNGTFYLLMRALGALAAPFFLICAGMGLEYLRGRWGGEPVRFRQAMVRRGLFLMLFATLLHVYRLNLATLFDWNIFALIGFWYLLSSPLAGVPWYLAVPLIAGILGLNAMLPIGKPWFLRDGSFPPVPFSVYFLLGILLAKARSALDRLNPWLHLAGAAGLLTLLVALMRTLHLASLTRFDVWSLKGVVAISALFVLLIGSLWRIPEGATWSGKLFWPLTQMGKLAFSLYYVQFFFLLLLPGAVRVLTRQEVLLVWPNLVWVALILSFLALLCGVVTVWEQFKFKFSIEWFMSTYVSQRSQIQEQKRTTR
jgi:hypothetical protein